MNSSTERTWRSPKASSLRTRPRWKSASPLTTPATCQSAMPSPSPTRATASVSQAGGPDTTRSANGSATSPTPPSTASASQIELCTTNTIRRAGPSAPSPQATVAEAPRRRSARPTSDPGSSTTSDAVTSRSQRPIPSAGSRRATPSSGRERRRIGAPLALRRSAHTPVPFIGELAQPGSGDTPRVPHVQPHAPAQTRIAPCDRRQTGAHRILDTGRDRGDAGPRCAVVLAPVPVPAPPHLVDAPFRDPGAELRLVVDNGDLRVVVHLPARLPEAELEVDLLRVEEELLVEEPDLVERLATQHEGGAHHPIDSPRRVAVRLLDAQLPDGEEPERAHGRRRKAPRGVLPPPVGIHELGTEGGDARIRAEIRGHPLETPTVRGGVLVQDVHVTPARRADDGVVVRAEAGPELLRDHADVGKALPHGLDGAVL